MDTARPKSPETLVSVTLEAGNPAALEAATFASAISKSEASREFATDKKGSFCDAAAPSSPVLIEDNGSLTTSLHDPRLANLLLSFAPRGELDVPDLDVIPDSLAVLPAKLAELLDVQGIASVTDLDETIKAIVALFQQRDSIEATIAILLERARRQVIRCAEVVNADHPKVQHGSGEHFQDLQLRCLASEVALATKQTETLVTKRIRSAQTLTLCAPQTLSRAAAGQVPWRNAETVADLMSDLPANKAALLDSSVAYRATCQNPARFRQTARRIRNRLHPVPLEVRHAEAATKRSVAVIPADDGMAYLSLYAPSPAIHAIYDRLVQTARTAKTEEDGRTQAQLHADVMCALLLDDGTLDLTGSSQATLFNDRNGNQSSHGSVKPGGPESALSSGYQPQADKPPGQSTVPKVKWGEPPKGSHSFSLAKIARSISPKVHVTVPILTLLNRADIPATLNGVEPIDADTARELAALAPSLSRLLTDPIKGNVLAVDSRTYRPTADLAQWITQRDGSCRWPGCGAAASRSDIDHTIPFSESTTQGGKTVDSNLEALCRKHHVMKHQLNYRLTQNSDGSGKLSWVTPLGRNITETPEPVAATIHETIPRYSPLEFEESQDNLDGWDFPEEPPF
jgi:hypothetical protein